MCGAKGRINSDSLLETLGINKIQTLRYIRLFWFGHVASNDDCINRITALEADGHRRQGRTKKAWRLTINDDRKNQKLTRVHPANRIEWREKFRINMGSVRPTLIGTSTLNES